LQITKKQKGNKIPKTNTFTEKSLENCLVEKLQEKTSDIAKENKAKYNYAKKHFENLNNILKKKKIKTKYFFTYLTPKDFGKFFEYLKQVKIEKFNSEINIALEE